MPQVMNFSCVNMRMTMNEALVAATINSAYALNRSTTQGSLEAGKWADMVIVNSSKWEHVIYQIADPPIEYVFKKGKIVYRNQ